MQTNTTRLGVAEAPRHWTVRLWDTLTLPSAQITLPRTRRQARLLAAFLLVATFSSLVATPFDDLLASDSLNLRDPLTIFRGLAYVSWVGVYFLSRSRFFRAAIWGTVLLATLEVLLSAVYEEMRYPLYYLVIIVFISSFMLRLRHVVLVAIGQLLLVLALPLWAEAIDPSANIVAFTLLGGGVVVLMTFYRNWLARDQIDELAAAEEERLQITGELARQYHILDAALSSTPDHFHVHDRKGRYLYVSPAALAAFGGKAEQVTGKTWRDLGIPSDIGAEFENRLKRVFENGETITTESTAMIQGGLRHYRQVLSPFRDDAGRIALAVSTTYDITAEVQQAAQVQKYADRVTALQQIDRAILEAQSPQEIAETALHHLKRLVPAERLSVALFDFEIGEVAMLAVLSEHPTKVGAGYRHTNYNFDANSYIEDLRTAGFHVLTDLQAMTNLTFIQQFLADEGIQSSMAVPLAIQGRLMGSVNMNSMQPNRFTAEDVELAREVAHPLAIAIHQARLHEAIKTHADEMEQRVQERTIELEKANIRLKEMDALKSKFVADISHEFRTPLAVIATRLYLLENDKRDRVAEHVGVLKNMSYQLAEMVDDVFQIARLDVSDMVVEFSAVDLNAIVTKIMTEYRPRSEAAGLALIVELAPELPPIRAEAAQLRQAVSQLVENAITYTPTGQVSVTTRLTDNPMMAQVEIRDTGVGIASDELPYIFERFYRGKQVGQMNLRGTGLGLAIAREIVSLHHGQIEFESAPGSGTIVKVKLPLVDD